MALLLAALFIVLPLLELYVIVQVAQAVGVLETLLALVALFVAGVWLVKRQGLAVWRRFDESVAVGRVPGKELADGALLLLAGAFLLFPGFLTDAVGVALLLPPVRAGVRRVLRPRWSRGRVRVIRASSTGPIDVTGTETPPERPTRAELPRP